MNDIVTVRVETFQEAWATVVSELKVHNWQLWSLVVQIKNPLEMNDEFHKNMERFAKSHNLVGQNQVAYTIFPYKLYKKGRERKVFYERYWKYFCGVNLHKFSNWGGTYFERMIRYRGNKEEIDQLGTIIDAINNRTVNCGASFVMVIPYPYKDIKRKMGSPCLNYVTVQVDTTTDFRYINLCAVYRNHDFCERAYGNYYGLGKLMEYIAFETNSKVGYLTCVSSKAYISKHRSELKNLAEGYFE